MLFNVPQYIDVEDKVAGPLTAKQLLWMFGLGAALIVLWNVLEKGAFFAVAIPVGLAFAALAFYRPYGQPLTAFIGSGFSYLFSPKIYSWRRLPQKHRKKKDLSQAEIESLKVKKKKDPVERDVVELARLLDTRGKERSQRIREIIKEKTEKNKK